MCVVVFCVLLCVSVVGRVICLFCVRLMWEFPSLLFGGCAADAEVF